MLCKGRSDTLVRYALAGAPAPLAVAPAPLAVAPAPLAVADYTYDTLPPQERGGLPTGAELTAALKPPGS